MYMVKYQVLDNELTPVEVNVNGFSTPVWIQQRIKDVQNFAPLNYSGCGHCSVSMVLNLRGQKVTPWEEYAKCLELFGEQGVSHNGNKQYPFLSVTGMVKVFNSFGLKSKCFGVKNGDRKSATEQIIKELKNGKLVAMVSCPSEEFPNNPFSKGHHWVVLAGFDEKGNVVVLNSSLGGDYSESVLGINVVDAKTIEMALSKVANPTDKTWGELENLDSDGCGFVVIE